MTARVGVVMPVRNAAATVRVALESVLAQTLRDIEVLVVLDGDSADGTDQLVEELAELDNRVRLLRGTGQGVTDACQQGWQATTAPCVAGMDADDVSFPDRLLAQR